MGANIIIKAEEKRKQNRFKAVLFLAATLALFILPGCSEKPTAQRTIKAEDGKITLNGWDFTKNGNVRLNGNWEFYWDQIINPDEFKQQDHAFTGFYPVPLYWTKYGDLKLPAKGRATYRITVEADGAHEILSIKTPEIYTEYCLWVNGRVVESNGSFANEPLRYLNPEVYSFLADGNKIEIVLQVKNEAHVYAGPGQSFLLGTPYTVYRERNIKTAIDLILFVLCAYTGVYHFIQFFKKSKEYELLSFSVFCFAVAIRGMIANETFVMQLWPDMLFETGSRLVTAIIPISVIAILLYVFYLYKNETPKCILWIFIGINVLYTVIVLVTNSYFYSVVFSWYLFSVPAVCGFILFIILRSILRGSRDSIMFLCSSIFIIAGAINDVLYFQQKINTGHFLGLGLTIFAVAQSILLAVRFGELMNEKELLYQKLNDTDIAFMQAQIKPHFIYNSLSAISNAITRDPTKAKELLLNFSDYLRASFSFKNLSGMTTLAEELKTVKAYLAVEKARFRERLEVEFHIDESPNILIPMLCIQPIVENSVRHGLMNRMEGGTVKITVWHENRNTHIVIEDDGIGMDQKKLEALFLSDTTEGIGLKNIDARLRMKYGRGLSITSSSGAGTRAEMIISRCFSREEEATVENTRS